MFELEIPYTKGDEADIASSDADRNVVARSVMPWEEHCTECAMPACYSTCDLYTPRADGKCRRFARGFVPVGVNEATGHPIVRVEFLRWGVLTAYANARPVPSASARRIESTISRIDRAVSLVPDAGLNILGRRKPSARLMRRVKRSVADRGASARPAVGPPDAFRIEVGNPSDAPVSALLTVSYRDTTVYDTGFQQRVTLAPGRSRIDVPAADIAKRVDLEQPLMISLDPHVSGTSDGPITLDFHELGFVWLDGPDPSSADGAAKAVKLVGWDLDRTLWDGILVEDGAERVRLRDGVRRTLEELDRRGILNTISSKNDESHAWPVLERLGVSDFFLAPQIHWEPKSASVSRLVELFDIGADTVAFIDDQPFERDEVARAVPGVRTFDAEELDALTTLPEFDPPTSEQSAGRREQYRAQLLRREVKERFADDYLGFLASCSIVATVGVATTQNIARVHELVQRTNQMNFAGTRYSRERLHDLVDSEEHLALTIDCVDCYGDYGTVGFAVFHVPTGTLEDLMFSCRVQAKRVEHAFLAALAEHHRGSGATTLRARYRRTDRNAKVGQVFSDLGFALEEGSGAVGETTTFALDLSSPDLGEQVVRVDWRV